MRYMRNAVTRRQARNKILASSYIVGGELEQIMPSRKRSTVEKASFILSRTECQKEQLCVRRCDKPGAGHFRKLWKLGLFI